MINFKLNNPEKKERQKSIKEILTISIVIIFLVYIGIVCTSYLYLLPLFLLLTFIVLGTFLSFIYLHKKEKLTILLSILIIAVLIASTVSLNYYKNTGYVDNASLYVKYPVRLNVHIEDLLNDSYCLGVIDAACKIIEYNSNVSISISNMSTLKNDNKLCYDNSSLNEIVPSGNFASTRFQAQREHVVNIDLFCLLGHSDEFVGKASLGGPWVVLMFEDRYEYDFWNDVHVAIHELGHTFGSDHCENEANVMYKQVNTSYIPHELEFFSDRVLYFSNYTVWREMFNETYRQSISYISYSEISDHVNFQHNYSTDNYDEYVYVFNGTSNSLEKYHLKIYREVSYNDLRSSTRITMSKISVPLASYGNVWGLSVNI